MEPTPVAVAMASLEAALAGLQEALHADLFRSLDPEIAELAEAAHRCERRTRSVTLGLVAELTERGVPEAVGAVNTRSWLRHRLRDTVAASGATARMAVACSPKGPHPEVGLGLADGSLSWEQAQTIVRALDRLPAKATLDEREFARDLLLDKAAELNADDLRTIWKNLREAIDPDGTLPDDEDVDRLRTVSYRDHHDGTHSILWRDRIENIGLAKAAIGALDAPVPQSNGSPDPRPAPVRRADALTGIFGGLLRHGEDLPQSRGRAPHLHLAVGLDALKGLTAAAKSALATGGALSAEAVRRLACDAEITPIVLDAYGKPLSVGRRCRTWTPAIWDALVARDTGCTFPACIVPAAWCRGHHIRHWADGGPTSLDNGVLLCERHHVEVHHRGWEVRLNEHGIPEFLPPPWIDSTRQPRRNEHWRQRGELLLPMEIPNRE